MKWALLLGLGSTGVIIVALCLFFLFLRGRLRRQHRVDPRVPTDAPMAWLADPRAPGRLHRRLTRVGRTARAVADDHRPASRRLRKADAPPPLVGLAEDLVAQAVSLDRQLARLANLAAGARRSPLAELSRSVEELETAAARLVGLSAEIRAPRHLAADDVDLLDVTAQVARMAEAQQALRDLDEQSGLRATTQPAPPLTTSPPARQTSPPAPPPPPPPPGADVGETAPGPG